MCKEVRGGVGFEGMALFNLSASARDMHLRFADFYPGKLGGGFFQNWVVGFAGFTGCEAIGDDRGGGIGEFFIVFVSDVFDCSCHEFTPRLKRNKRGGQLEAPPLL